MGCMSCLENKGKTVKVQCGHRFCDKCILNFVQTEFGYDIPKVQQQRIKCLVDQCQAAIHYHQISTILEEEQERKQNLNIQNETCQSCWSSRETFSFCCGHSICNQCLINKFQIYFKENEEEDIMENHSFYFKCFVGACSQPFTQEELNLLLQTHFKSLKY